ncbi:protein RarD [Carnobacterium divergens]|uniref:EamA family transporter RarD n=1 Tax=Carnobacterium divergens TaxID=2748 RepID=UPI001072B6B5|nr:EamA family transporter RarD [Carnobacterium divergens]TFJ41151.1 protein RarD [Carnobacterium divergens]TFJ49790.1 protein RarD [Carnobacterium divergens]TFJ55075.1 protein RarD [Carnobacterium divergens]TFJ61641.1 protein RarD [Carnobacterium divergens]TFJ71563.1 protein RarD [Carnobacterium divergens]
MNNHSEQNEKKGLLSGIGAYLIWGVLPLYWKALGSVSPLSVLSYRIIWSFVFMLVVLCVTRKWKNFKVEALMVIKDKKRRRAIILAALFITVNWFIFIFTVTSGNVVEASLGYYINPLANILIATLFLKERLSRIEKIACVLATIGVVGLAIQTGAIPWAALAMATTFSLYGLIKKQASVSSLTGLTLETSIMAPIAMIYLCFFAPAGFMSYSPSINLLAIGAGVVTAIPLFLFAEAAKNISYILLGFLQYIGPTLMLISAVFLFNETFAGPQLLAFGCIWLGILLFTINNLVLLRKRYR